MTGSHPKKSRINPSSPAKKRESYALRSAVPPALRVALEPACMHMRIDSCEEKTRKNLLKPAHLPERTWSRGYVQTSTRHGANAACLIVGVGVSQYLIVCVGVCSPHLARCDLAEFEKDKQERAGEQVGTDKIDAALTPPILYKRS